MSTMRDVVSHMNWGAGRQGGGESLDMLLTKICDESELSRHDMKERAVWIVARSTAGQTASSASDQHTFSDFHPVNNHTTHDRTNPTDHRNHGKSYL